MNLEIVKKGHTEAHIRIAGILQLHKFLVSKEKTAFGTIPVLAPERKVILPLTEAIKMANELDLPVRCSAGLVFPTGQFAKDFALK